MPRKMSAAEKHAGRVRIMNGVKECLEKAALSRDNLSHLAMCFRTIGNRIEKGNFDRAKVLRREFWFRAGRESSYLGLYSEGEIVDMLNRHGRGSWYLGTARQLEELLNGFNELLRCIEIVRAVFNRDTYRLLVSLNEEVRKRVSAKNTLEDSESLRRGADAGAKKFLELARVVANLSVLVPVPGLQDYIRYNFEMVKGAKTLFDNVRDYADRIVAELNELDKATGRGIGNPNSWWNLNSVLTNPRATDQLIDGRWK